jgi:hypothetical protein
MPDDVTPPPGPADVIGQFTATADLTVTPASDVKDGDDG